MTYSVNLITAANVPAVMQKLRLIPEFNELGDVALKFLLSSSVVVVTGSHEAELETLRNDIIALLRRRPSYAAKTL